MNQNHQKALTFFSVSLRSCDAPARTTSSKRRPLPISSAIALASCTMGSNATMSSRILTSSSDSPPPAAVRPWRWRAERDGWKRRGKRKGENGEINKMKKKNGAREYDRKRRWKKNHEPNLDPLHPHSVSFTISPILQFLFFFFALTWAAASSLCTKS